MDNPARFSRARHATCRPASNGSSSSTEADSLVQHAIASNQASTPSRPRRKAGNCFTRPRRPPKGVSPPTALRLFRMGLTSSLPRREISRVAVCWKEAFPAAVFPAVSRVVAFQAGEGQVAAASRPSLPVAVLSVEHSNNVAGAVCRLGPADSIATSGGFNGGLLTAPHPIHNTLLILFHKLVAASR